MSFFTVCQIIFRNLDYGIDCEVKTGTIYLTYLTLGETIEILKQRNFNRKEDFILANTRNPVVEICKLKHNRMKSDMK